MQGRQSRSLATVGPPRLREPDSLGAFSRGLGLSSCLVRYCKPKLAPTVDPALDPYLPPVKLHELADQREAQARAFSHVCVGADLSELLEDRGLIFRRDSRSGVGYGYLGYPPPLAPPPLRPCRLLE